MISVISYESVNNQNNVYYIYIADIIYTDNKFNCLKFAQMTNAS